jgi:uncharacterized membrane protein
MNAAHFHLVVNHLPLIFPLVGLCVLIGGLLVKSDIVKRVSFIIFVAGALCTILAMTSGEGAEEILEETSGFSEDLVHEHEEAAEFFAVLNYILGLLAAFSVWANWKKTKYSTALDYVVLVGALMVLSFARQTGTSGGEISHPEIRNESATKEPLPEEGEME